MMAQLQSMPPGAGAEPSYGAYILNVIAAGAQLVSCTEGGPSVLVAVLPAAGFEQGALIVRRAKARRLTPRCVLEPRWAAR